MHKNFYWYKLGLESWIKCIGDDINNKIVKIEAEIEIEIESWDTQQPESLLHLIRKRELDKYNDEAFDSLIDFNLYISQTYLLTYFYIWPLYMTFTYLIFYFNILSLFSHDI